MPISTAKRREDQITRTKLRLEREKAEMTALTENLDLSTFNQFRWSKKVSRSSLLKLYQGDAKGILDEELLDDVGYTFFTRLHAGAGYQGLLGNRTPDMPSMRQNPFACQLYSCRKMFLRVLIYLP